MTIFVIPSEGGAPVQATAEQIAQIREQLGARSQEQVASAASAAVAAHVNVADPHSQYMNQQRGDQRYSPINHAHANHVLSVNNQTPGPDGNVQIEVGTGQGTAVPVVNNLTSTATSSALSAAQGPILSSLIAAKQGDLGFANLAALNTAVDGRADARISAQKGAANGLVPLGTDSKISAAYLPSYVDDVLEYANVAGFPATGESGKIYVDLSTSPASQYRWSGSAYAPMGSVPQYASQAEAEAGTENTKTATALRVAQAIAARAKDALLTGWTVGANAAVAAGESISAAIGKLQGQINALATAIAGKPDSLPFVNIDGTTAALTIAAHANRQLRWSGATRVMAWPSDAGAGDLAIELVESPGSPGHLTITFPNGRSITSNQAYTVGAGRKGVDVYDTGDTNPAPSVTNLGFTRDASTLTVTSSTGTPAVIPLASSTQAGLLSPAEKEQIGAAAAAEPLTVTGSNTVGSVLTAAPNGNWIITPGQWYTRSGAGGATLTPIASATALTFNTTGRTAGDQITYKPDNIAFAPAGITLTAAAVVPTLSGFTISNSTPGVMTFNSSQALTSADIAGGTGGFALTFSGGAITVTAVDVNGTGPHTATLSRNVTAGEACTVDYAPGSSSAPFASASGAVVAFTNVAVTNNVAGAGGITLEDARVNLFSEVGDGTTSNLVATGANRALFAIAACIYGSNVITDIKRGGSAGTSLTRLGADQTFMFGGAGAAAFGGAGAIPSPETVFGDFGGAPPVGMVGAVLLSGLNQATPFLDYGTVPLDDGNEITSMPLNVTISDAVPNAWYIVGVPWGSGSGDAIGAVAVAGTQLAPNQAASGLGGMFFLLKQATGTSVTLQATITQAGDPNPNFISSRAFYARLNPA